jgi:probable addiction module antidote protein
LKDLVSSIRGARLDQSIHADTVDAVQLGRESLYKALAPGAKPRFDTVLKVVRALGVKLTAKVS